MPDQMYTYTRFKDDEGMRLLQLHAGRDGAIRASLIHARFEIESDQSDPGCVSSQTGKRVNYDAISWSWGQEDATEMIELMDGQDLYYFKLKPRLEKALRAMRSEHTARNLWVDAICINQDDNYEKSHQVPLMNKIYSGAEAVCVWLGPSESSKEKVGIAGARESENVKMAFKFIRNLREDMDYEKTLNNLGDDKTQVEHLKAMSALMQRDWFSRRWIIQEIALAKTAKIFCGKEDIGWEGFAEAIELFVQGESKTRLADKLMQSQEAIPQYWGNMSALGATRLVMATLKLSRRPTKKYHRPQELMSLEDIVCELEGFRTSFPHDTVYAYLAIAKDTVPVAYNKESSHKAIKQLLIETRDKFKAKRFLVDYNKSYAAVCQQFLEFSIEQCEDRRRALNILCRPWAHEGEEAKLPRWATTLAYASFEIHQDDHDDTIMATPLYRRNGDPFVSLTGPSSYKAAGDLEIGPRRVRFQSFKSEDGTTDIYSLLTPGFVLDEIDVIKDKVTTSGLVPEEWLTLGLWNDPNEYPPDELLRTLTADRGLDGSNCPRFYSSACRKALRLSQSKRDIDTKDIIGNPNYTKSAVADFCRRVQQVVVNRKLIRTKRGKYLGLVSAREVAADPNDSQSDKSGILKGDLICILQGCSVPVILRKKKKPDALYNHEERLYDDSLQKARKVTKELVARWRKKNAGKGLGSPPPASATRKSQRLKGLKGSTTPGSSRSSTPACQPAQNVKKRKSNASHPDHGKKRMRQSDENARPQSQPSRNTAQLLDPKYYYEFWGEAYIHGMMDGEAIELQNRSVGEKDEGGRIRTVMFDLR